MEESSDSPSGGLVGTGWRGGAEPQRACAVYERMRTSADGQAGSSLAQARGCSAIHVSSGGLHPAQKIPVGPSYQVPLARAIKQAVDIPIVAVGMITGFEQAEAIVGTGDADLVALARGMLFDPRWPWHAAAELGGKVKAPPQYLRSQPRQHRELFDFGQ